MMHAVNHHIPTFEYESPYWQQGMAAVAGIDEVGMGALAGPVVAAAVVWAPGVMITGVRDSKVLSATRREALALQIQVQSQAWAVGEASVAEITTLNIRRAAHLAMRRAVEQLSVVPQLLLIDGSPAQPHPHIPAVSIIRGDAQSLSIAAASILAKVHRDRGMVVLDEQFPAYGFATHKGYGSARHLAALAEFGPCPHHRPTYAPVAELIARK